MTKKLDSSEYSTNSFGFFLVQVLVSVEVVSHHPPHSVFLLAGILNFFLNLFLYPLPDLVKKYLFCGSSPFMLPTYHGDELQTGVLYTPLWSRVPVILEFNSQCCNSVRDKVEELQGIMYHINNVRDLDALNPVCVCLTTAIWESLPKLSMSLFLFCLFICFIYQCQSEL